MNTQRIASILALLALLALSMGLDWFNSYFDRLIRARMVGGFLTSLWVDLGIRLLFASAVLALAWLVLVKKQLDHSMAVVYMLVGALVIFFGTPLFVAVRSLFAFWLGTWLPLLLILPSSLFFLSGLFVLLLGIYRLVQREN